MLGVYIRIFPDLDSSRGGITNEYGAWGNQAQRSAADWLHRKQRIHNRAWQFNKRVILPSRTMRFNAWLEEVVMPQYRRAVGESMFNAHKAFTANMLPANVPAKPKLLDLFCGAGGGGMGYHRAGFEVTGVDINPQPNYPFRFIQGDALQYVAEHGHEYDVIVASPPCQGYSVTMNMHPQNKYPDLVAKTRAALIATGKPYVIENVVNAPLRGIKLSGLMFPDTLRVIRNRIFESNILLLQPARHKKRGYTSGRGKGYSSFDDGYYITVAGHNYRYRDGCVAMGIDWMTQDELSESIPPVYTEYIGRQLMRHIQNSKPNIVYFEPDDSQHPYFPQRIGA